MPIPWVGIGKALGGMGQFAGGLSSLFSGDEGFSGSDIKDALKARLVAARVYGEKFGFHPLAALGVQPYMAGGQKAFKDTGRAMANMGQGLQRALTGSTELDKAKARYYDSLAEKVETEKDIETISETPTEDTGLYQTPLKSTQGVQGWETGEQGSNKVTFNPEGYLIIAPTQGLEDFVSEDLLSKVRFHAPAIIRGVKAGYYNVAPYTKNARAFRKELRSYLDALEKTAPPKAGYYYTWSTKYGTPRRIPISKYRRQQLFDSSGDRLGRYDRYIKSSRY